MKDLPELLRQTADEREFEWKEDLPLSALTSFRTGGPASVLFPLTQNAAVRLYAALKKAKVPVFVLGGGTNVIARDEGYEGVVFSTEKLRAVRVEGDRIRAESGVPVTLLATKVMHIHQLIKT